MSVQPVGCAYTMIKVKFAQQQIIWQRKAELDQRECMIPISVELASIYDTVFMSALHCL